MNTGLILAIFLIGIIGAMLQGCGSVDVTPRGLQTGAWNIKPDDISLKSFKVSFSRSF